MGYYINDTEKALKDLEKHLDKDEFTNVLTNMDNWTYHIRLSVLPFDKYQTYQRLKKDINYKNEKKQTELEKLIDANGIVIVETGVIHDLFIDSLTLKTISSNGQSFTTEGTLRLVDTNGTGFINRLNAMNLLIGNGSHYSNQIYFLTIWFTGYNGSALAKPGELGMPNKEINVFNRTEDEDKSPSKIYYEVTFDTADCTVSMNKANWLMHFVTTNSSYNVPNEVLVLSDIPEIKIGKGQGFLKTVSDELVSHINTKLKNMYKPETFNSIFASENDKNGSCLEVNIYNTSQDTITHKTIPTLLYSTNSEKNKGIKDKKEFDIYAKKETSLKFSSKINLLNVFNTVFESCSSQSKDLKEFYPRIGISNIPAKVYQGKLYYKTEVSIYLTYVPGFDICRDVVSNPNELKKIKDKQLDILNKHRDIFIRKYEWMTGNNKNCLLSYDAKMNNMWFLNSGAADRKSAADNTILTPSSRGMNNESIQIVQISTNEQTKSLKDLGTDINSFKTMNDVWEYIRDKKLINNLPLFPFAIKDCNIGANDPIDMQSGTIEENIEIASARIGFENLRSSGQATEITLNIIGDPVWLDIGSAINVTDMTNNMNVMILFKCNTTFNLDKWDNYVPDDLTQFMTPYVITEVASDFSNGAFKQELKGNIPPTFLIDNITTEALQNMVTTKNPIASSNQSNDKNTSNQTINKNTGTFK